MYNRANLIHVGVSVCVHVCTMYAEGRLEVPYVIYGTCCLMQHLALPRAVSCNENTPVAINHIRHS